LVTGNDERSRAPVLEELIEDGELRIPAEDRVF
jgi:hypothetical protein